jgi:hypothetical protein
LPIHYNNLEYLEEMVEFIDIYNLLCSWEAGHLADAVILVLRMLRQEDYKFFPSWPTQWCDVLPPKQNKKQIKWTKRISKKKKNLNRSETSRGIETVTKNLPRKRNPVLDGYIPEFYQTFK